MIVVAACMLAIEGLKVSMLSPKEELCTSKEVTLSFRPYTDDEEAYMR